MFRFVDCSNNQLRVNFAALKAAGVGGSYLKVTEGTGFVDQTYPSRNIAARAAGLRVGGYHFGHPDKDPVAQAHLFLDHLHLRPGDLLPVLDIEVLDGQTGIATGKWAQAWLAEVGKRIGSKPLVYSGDYFARANLSRLFPEYGLWVADYGGTPGSKFVAWQWTDHGVAGLDESKAASLTPLLHKPPLVRKVVHRLRPRWWA